MTLWVSSFLQNPPLLHLTLLLHHFAFSLYLDLHELTNKLNLHKDFLTIPSRHHRFALIHFYSSFPFHAKSTVIALAGSETTVSTFDYSSSFPFINLLLYTPFYNTVPISNFRKKSRILISHQCSLTNSHSHYQPPDTRTTSFSFLQYLAFSPQTNAHPQTATHIASGLTRV